MRNSNTDANGLFFAIVWIKIIRVFFPLDNSKKAAESRVEPFVNHSKSQNPWIAGLSSFAIHLLILLVMAVFTLSRSGSGKRLSIESGSSNEPNDQIDTVLLESQQTDEPSPSSFSSDQISSAVLITDVQPTLEIEAGNQLQAADTISEMVRHAGSDNSGKAATFISSSLEGRSAKNRSSIGLANGATPASEAAVELALAYLARHQRSNGSWTMNFDECPCHGQCDHSSSGLDAHEIAATGLALLCFLGAGHTMQEGQYSENVNRGIYYLVQNLKARQTGSGSWLSTVNRAEMYEHGIGTLALCEALQMKGDAELLTKPCQETINFIVFAQHPGGGWDYHPRSGPGDLSIMGWQIMALKSALSAKIVVNAGTIRGIDAFLSKTVRNEFLFVYNQENKPKPSMTAIGTLMRIYRGWSKTDPAIIKAVEYLSKQGPSAMDLYYDYYATQVMFQYGEKAWKTWNPKMRDHLVNSQERDGHMAGSWWFPGEKEDKIYNSSGGRFYLTTMACLTLEVYYRYLPVYDSVSQEFQF